jgi:hypothetical protein
VPHLEAILRIIELSLQITLKIMEDMPPDEKRKAWERHAKFMEFWEGLAKLFAKEP